MGYPDEREIELMAAAGCKVAHCPSASMLGAYGVFANGMMPKMADAGITILIALGTDSATAGGHLDMVRVMYLAACGHKDIAADASIWGAHKALEMATIDGARACLWDARDRLAGGRQARRHRAGRPLRDRVPSRTAARSRPLVYSGTGKNVDTVIIDGRIVMRHRTLLTVDLELVKKELARASRRLARARRHRDAAALAGRIERFRMERNRCCFFVAHGSGPDGPRLKRTRRTTGGPHLRPRAVPGDREPL